MNKSQRWLGSLADKRTSAKFGELRSVGMSDSRASTRDNVEFNEHGEKLFIVGVSRVGDDEVTG